MTIIDVHAHYLPPEAIPRHAIERSGAAVTLTFGNEQIGPVDASIVDFSLQLEALARGRIATRVLSLPPFALGDNFSGDESIAFCRDVNERLATISANSSGRFLAFATVPLRDPLRSVDVLREAVESHGLCGVEICSYAGALELDDASLEPFWTAAESLEVPVLVHPHKVAGPERMALYYMRNLVGNPFETALAAARLVFGGVLARHPRIKIVLSHGGGAFPFIVGRLQHGAHVRPESNCALKPRDVLSRLYVDTVVFDPAILRALLTIVPASHALLGSDSPFSMSDGDPVSTVELAIQQGIDREAVLGGTARSLLRIKDR
jgi:aminocarboxymuconate-semialdehyde decarboxylase